MTERSKTVRAAGHEDHLASVSKTDTVHHESRRKGKRPKGMTDLNLTSMLDVCFQLLIFFILTASFAVGEGILPAELPAGQGKPSDTEAPEQPIKLYLRSLGGDDVSIQIEGSPTPPRDFRELFSVLQGMQNSPQNPSAPYNADDPVIIKPDGTVKWMHVVNTFNAAIRAKYTNVNFAQPNK
jgi:biopolymer transport protein ExbD